MQERRPFRKVNQDKWIAGVCGGIAYALGWSGLFVRFAFILFVIVSANPYVQTYVGAILFWSYILAWIFAPKWAKDPEDYEERTK